jgi:hypothetical protein
MFPQHIRTLATSPSFILYVGKVEKRGKVKWAERWLILNEQKLVVYRSRYIIIIINYDILIVIILKG